MRVKLKVHSGNAAKEKVYKTNGTLSCVSVVAKQCLLHSGFVGVYHRVEEKEEGLRAKTVWPLCGRDHVWSKLGAAVVIEAVDLKSIGEH